MRGEEEESVAANDLRPGILTQSGENDRPSVQCPIKGHRVSHHRAAANYLWPDYTMLTGDLRRWLKGLKLLEIH